MTTEEVPHWTAAIRKEEGDKDAAGGGDLHCKRSARGAFEALFAAMAAAADVLVLCGDLTDYGLADEARVLVEELATAKPVPVVAVLSKSRLRVGPGRPGQGRPRRCGGEGARPCKSVAVCGKF